jgi:hypothetical protein
MVHLVIFPQNRIFYQDFYSLWMWGGCGEKGWFYSFNNRESYLGLGLFDKCQHSQTFFLFDRIS